MSARNLINKYAVKEETFTIELWGVNPETQQPEVDTLTVRQVKGTRQLAEVKQMADKFFAMLTNSKTAPPQPFRAFLPIDEKTAEMVYVVSALVVDPPFSQLETLEMARDAGPLLTRIHGEIMGRNVLAAGMMDQEVIEATKKLSKPTPSIANSSSSDATASESTLNVGTPTTGDTPSSSGLPE